MTYGPLAWFLRSLVALIALATATANARSLTETANAASKGLGKTVAVYQGRLGPVFLFEEEHASRAGQIEIANMLVRLHNSNGLRNIGLEGFSEQKLEPKWAETMPTLDRKRLAARLLGEGELSSADFMALAYNDTAVVGIDSPADYKIELDDRAAVSRLLYLMMISQSALSRAEQARLLSLLEQKKIKEATELSINSDPWTKKAYADLTSQSASVSNESMLQQVDLIEAEAKKRSVLIPDGLARDFQRYKAFLQAAERRSDYMVAQLVKLASEPTKPLIAAVIGAAHTERMVKLLREKEITVAVVRPNALNSRSNGDTLVEELQSYKRKLEGKSVDVRGLGVLLDNRRKPPPVLLQPWLIRKALIYQTTIAVVDRVLVANDQPPYKIDSLPPGYRVDFSKMSRIGDEILFPIEFDSDSGKQTIWVRAAYSRNVVASGKEPKSIEARIERLLQDSGGGGRGGDGDKPLPLAGHPKPEKSPKGEAEPKTIAENTRQVAEGIYAAFGDDKPTLENQVVLTAGKE